MQVLYNKFILIVFITSSLVSCKNDTNELIVSNDELISEIVSVIDDSIIKSELVLKKDIGTVFYKDQPFTGTSVLYYDNDTIAESISYVDGIREGIYKKWFRTGLLSYSSRYKSGKIDGVSSSWWKNGKLRSETNHVNGIANGTQRQWYVSGERFKEINLVNGKEEGLQRTWRKNGKLYNNYEAKNGRIFGLKRASLCFQLEDEEVQYKIL